jgi:hypothetical protein
VQGRDSADALGNSAWNGLREGLGSPDLARVNRAATRGAAFGMRMAHRCSNAAEGSFEVELAWPGCDAVLADFASQNNLPPTASPASWERLTGAYPGSIRFDSVGNNGRFLYSAEILRDLPLAMSAERFQRYLTETSGNDWKPVVSTPGTQRFHLLSTAHCRLLRLLCATPHMTS